MLVVIATASCAPLNRYEGSDARTIHLAGLHMGNTVIQTVELVTEAILLATVRQADSETLRCCKCRHEATLRFLLHGVKGYNERVVG